MEVLSVKKKKCACTSAFYVRVNTVISHNGMNEVFCILWCESTHVTEKQQSNVLLFGRKTVVGTFARHVREVYAFAKLKQSEISFESFYLNDIFNAALTNELSDTVSFQTQ